MRSRGFSLLEALVTLVIIALIATLLMQSLLHVLGLRERVLRHERDARVEALHERWFRDSIAAAVADRPGLAPAFSGDAAGLRLQSLDPLRAQGLTGIDWRLLREGAALRLEYAEAAERWTLGPDDLGEASFGYLASDGSWHTAWPRAGHADEVLPRAVRLVATSDGRERVWWAHIAPAPGLPPQLALRMEAIDGGL